MLTLSFGGGGAGSISLRAEKEVVLPAVRNDPSALQFAAAELLSDREVVLAAVGTDGRALRFASGELQADDEVVLAAVRQDGQALEHAYRPSTDDEYNREWMLAAVTQASVQQPCFLCLSPFVSTEPIARFPLLSVG